MNFLSLVFPFLEKIIPDPKARAEAQLKMAELQQAGEFREAENALKAVMGQLDVNKTEAASTSMFVAGWRPYIGWLCGSGLGYQFLLQPLLAWLSLAQGWPVPPQLELGDLITILTGMLGLSAMRTSEKFRGVAR